jgi:hypothetical protein
MMDQDFYYTIDGNKVAHEIIHGEAIVIHFDTGNYYSMDGIASQLWQWFAAGASRQQILDAFKDIQPDQIQILDAFIYDLVEEGLMEEKVADAGRQPASPLGKHEVTFESPKLARYSDMQNLLLADPIHDADETGWPNLDAESV